jgi:hypothetical protein
MLFVELYFVANRRLVLAEEIILMLLMDRRCFVRAQRVGCNENK